MPPGCLESNRNARAGTGDRPCEAIGYKSVRMRARLNAAEVSVEFSTEAQNLRHVIDTGLELAGASLSHRLGDTLTIARWLLSMRKSGALVLLESLLKAIAPVLTWPRRQLTGVAVKERRAPLRCLSLTTRAPGHSSYMENASGFLRDEGVAYAEKLKAAGTAMTHLHAPERAITFPQLQT
jgi:hypothetical protein